MSIKKDGRYSLPLAVTDLVPVLLFAGSWMVILFRSGGVLAGIGMGMMVAGGLSKAGWKLQIVRRGTENRTLQTLFRILMPAGGILSLAAAIRWLVQTPWMRIWELPQGLLLAGFLLGMMLMGFWSRLLDDSRKNTWIKELTNLVAQLFLLWYVIVY